MLSGGYVVPSWTLPRSVVMVLCHVARLLGRISIPARYVQMQPAVSRLVGLGLVYTTDLLCCNLTRQLETGLMEQSTRGLAAHQTVKMVICPQGVVLQRQALSRQRTTPQNGGHVMQKLGNRQNFSMAAS